MSIIDLMNNKRTAVVNYWDIVGGLFSKIPFVVSTRIDYLFFYFCAMSRAIIRNRNNETKIKYSNKDKGGVPPSLSSCAMHSSSRGCRGGGLNA